MATIEQVQRDLRGDVQAVLAEQQRMRERLHKLEGTTGGLVQVQRERLTQQDAASRKVQLRLNLLTVVIAAAALIEPLLIVGVRH